MGSSGHSSIVHSVLEFQLLDCWQTTETAKRPFISSSWTVFQRAGATINGGLAKQLGRLGVKSGQVKPSSSPLQVWRRRRRSQCWQFWWASDIRRQFRQSDDTDDLNKEDRQWSHEEVARLVGLVIEKLDRLTSLLSQPRLHIHRCSHTHVCVHVFESIYMYRYPNTPLPLPPTLVHSRQGE